jgi:D-psicose/D-tagatose/L-ribulose 3-epimerase
VLARVAPHFFERGITLGVEAVNRFETDLVTTAEEALALVDLVGAPNIGVHLDTFHMNIEERDIVSAVRHAGSRLVHIHVCGPNRGVPIPGRFPYSELFRALAEGGYSGWIGVEMFVQSGTSVSADLRIWRQIEASPTEAAREARELVHGWLSGATDHS